MEGLFRVRDKEILNYIQLTWGDLNDSIQNIPLPRIDITSGLEQLQLRSQTPLCWTHPEDSFNNSVSALRLSILVSSLALPTTDFTPRFRITPGRLLRAPVDPNFYGKQIKIWNFSLDYSQWLSQCHRGAIGKLPIKIPRRDQSKNPDPQAFNNTAGP